MDEKRFEELFQADAEKVIAKTRHFCREFYETDDAEFILDFITTTAETALLFGGYQRYVKILAFQAEILQDLADSKSVFDKEQGGNGRA